MLNLVSRSIIFAKDQDKCFKSSISKHIEESIETICHKFRPFG